MIFSSIDQLTLPHPPPPDVRYIKSRRGPGGASCTSAARVRMLPDYAHDQRCRPSSSPGMQFR